MFANLLKNTKKNGINLQFFSKKHSLLDIKYLGVNFLRYLCHKIFYYEKVFVDYSTDSIHYGELCPGVETIRGEDIQF